MNQSRTRSCPALLVTAPASGQGRTTVTAALARAWRNRGLHVQALRTGPDFIDPTILECVTGRPAYRLDLWMGGEDDCRRRLHAAGRTGKPGGRTARRRRYTAFGCRRAATA